MEDIRRQVRLGETLYLLAAKEWLTEIHAIWNVTLIHKDTRRARETTARVFLLPESIFQILIYSIHRINT
jgi:hypothetical protein